MTIDPQHATGPVPGPGLPPAWTPAPAAADSDPIEGARPPAAPPAPAAPAARRRPWGVVTVSILLVAALALAGYLWTTTRGYQELAASTEERAREIGTELATTRIELEGAVAELEGVRAQLSTAQARIIALADEKAQIGDDREAQRQLVDYQERVSVAAGTVASALGSCIRGQDQLITYLKDSTAYDPAELLQFESEVDGLCRSATDANQSLQDELSQ